jgi:hypothetical protein
MSWIIWIPVIAAGLSLFGILLELLMHDREKAKKIEFAIKRKQREIKQCQKDKDTKRMMECQKELMGLMGQNMKLRMRTMIVSFPLFIILFFFLREALAVAPLEAGGVSQVGVDIRNLDENAEIDVTLELVSDEIQVNGQNSRDIDLEEYGTQGDREQVWWNLTSSKGNKNYELKITSGNDSDSLSYDVAFVDAGSLTADFAPAAPSNALDGELEVIPTYHPVRMNIFGMQLDWYIYYIISFFIIALAISPLKNQILWGHPKGIKHLEKIDSQKNESKQE